jgi:hypothetical protein
MFERIRAAVTASYAVLSAPPSTAIVPAVQSDAAPDQPSGRADLIEIKVNGLDSAKQYAVWLTKGLDRTQSATAVRLLDCTSDHLKNIVANKPNLSADYLRVIESILEDRGEALDSADLHSDFAD